MDSVRVVVQNTEVGFYSAAEMGLSITWQNKLIDEVNSFAIPFTKTVKLPLTNELSLACGHPQEIDSAEFVSLKNRYTITIFVNESVSITGWIKPIRVILTDIDEWIEFSIHPRQKSWVEDLNAFNLTELDLSDQDHTLDVAEIRASEIYDPNVMYVYPPIDIAEVSRLPVLWVEQTGTDMDFYYLGEEVNWTTYTNAHSYGFVNTDLNFNWQTFINVPDATWNPKSIYVARTTGTVFTSTRRFDQTGYLFVQQYNWQVGDFYPCIRIKDILTRCFDRIGWQVNIPDSSYIDDKYNFQHNLEILNYYEEPRNKFKVKVYDGGYEFTKINSHTWIVPFYNTLKEGFIPLVSKYTDTNNNNSVNVDNGTNVSRFTADETTIMRFTWNCHVLYESLGGAYFLGYQDIDFRITHYNSANVVQRIVLQDRPIIKPNTGQRVEFNNTYQSSYVYMQTGDYIQCNIIFLGTFSGFATSVKITIFDDNILESIHYGGGNFRNKEIRLNEYLPEVTALEWLKDIALIHNLQFYTNDALKTVYVVRDDEKRTGKQLDFTQKINRLREIEIEEICGLHPKTYNFNWLKDTEDWSIDFIEIATNERFAKGVLTNLNDYATEVKEISTSIYSATLDKFELSNIMYFDTVEMKGKETWKSLPTWKRVDYKPRYLTLTFGETMSDHGLPYDDGESAVTYQIETSVTPLTYVRPEFQLDMHWGSSTTGLLKDYYTQFNRRMNFGQIVRAYLFINEKDVDTYATILEEDNDFRADYEIQIKKNVVTAELNKIIDYSPTTQDETRVEFIIFKDET